MYGETPVCMIWELPNLIVQGGSLGGKGRFLWVTGESPYGPLPKVAVGPLDDAQTNKSEEESTPMSNEDLMDKSVIIYRNREPHTP